MGKLFKIEMKKLYKSTAMRIMLIIVVVLSLISVASYAFIDSMGNELVALTFKITGHDIYIALLQDNSDTILLITILMAILIGSDFSARTLQMQLSAGYSRMQIVVSRFLSSIVAFLILFALYMLCMVGGITAIFGFGLEVTGDIIGNLVLKTVMCVFMSFSMIALYMLICFLLKSTGSSIGVCLPFMLIGTSILQALAMAFKTCKFIIELTPFGQIMLIGEDLNNLEIVKFFAVGAVWIIGMILINHATFKNAELK